MTIDEYRVMLFKQSLTTLDDSQLRWIFEKDYPDWQRALAKEEMERRRMRYANTNQDHRHETEVDATGG